MRQCAEMWGQPAKPLDWPPVRSKVVDGPAPIHWRARAQVESSDDDDEFAPETVEEAAEAAEIAEAKARVAHATAEAAALKAARASRSLSRLPGSERDEAAWIRYLTGMGENKHPLNAEEVSRRDAVFERCAAARRKLAVAVAAAQRAERIAAVMSTIADAKAEVVLAFEKQEETIQALKAKRQAAEDRCKVQAQALHENESELNATEERIAALELRLAQAREQERAAVHSHAR